MIKTIYRSHYIMIFPVFAAVLALLLTTPLSFYARASSNPTTLATNSSVLPPPKPQGIVNVGVTPNQKAAGGPLPGNHTTALQEAKCAASQHNPPWYPTIVPAEQYDSARTKAYGCAQFLGSYTAPNQVFAYASPVQYYTPMVMVTRGVNELYVLGGVWSNAIPPPSGPFVASINPGDLSQKWRTDLINLNATASPNGIWNYPGGLDVLADGSIAVIMNSYLYKLNGTTGAIQATLTLPTGKSLPENSAFNGIAAWPDGTLVMKDQTRPAGCSLNGQPALTNCPNQSQAPNSTIVVVDSKTWKVLDWKELPGEINSRVATSVYNGKDYAYLPGTPHIYRYIWDGKNITLDKTWSPTNLLKPNQTNLLAPEVGMGWVFDMTNGGPPSNVPLTVFAVSEANASKISRLDPMPLAPGQMSYVPTNPPIDPQNQMVYAMDTGAGKLVGIKFDPVTGKMSLAWSANQTTLSWWGLVGPADKRVTVASNIHPNTTLKQLINFIPPSYTEQIQWRDAATGKLLAASDYFSGMDGGSPTPGYGGLVYDLIENGHIMALQVLPKPTNATSPPLTAPSQN